MKKEEVVLFGAGKIGRKTYERYKDTYRIRAVIDNDLMKQGTGFAEGIKIISYEEYRQSYTNVEVMVSTAAAAEVEKQLREDGIHYIFSPVVFEDEKVRIDEDINHDNWPKMLKSLCDKEGMEVLEIGSRVVTGKRFDRLFENASYVGFDYYMGENVDVTGDAHRLSSYFDKKFDLIFSSAVFEHLAMPWQAALEIIKLLKPGGYVFIETHYSFSSHERPWHFFQFSENALDVLPINRAVPPKVRYGMYKKELLQSVGRAVFSRSVQVFTGQNSGRALLPFGILGKKGGGCGQRHTAVEQHNTGGRSWQHKVSCSYKKRHRSRSLRPLPFAG